MKESRKQPAFRRRMLEDQRRLSEQYGDVSLGELAAEAEACGDDKYAAHVRSKMASDSINPLEPVDPEDKR